MAAIVILLAALLSLLPVVAGSVNQYRQARQRWNGAVQAWNRAQRLRAEPAADGETVKPVARGLPLKRMSLEGGPIGPIGWEVLHGAR